MKLEEIGFYTLSDKRAKEASEASPLWRCELILTDKCNFRCPYCRGLPTRLRGDLPYSEAIRILDIWIREGLKNVRFSGGEPTLYRGLESLVERCRNAGVERIAISSNGSAPISLYDRLLQAGVDDVSVSLDAGCCSVGDVMTGGVEGSWDKAVETVRWLSSRIYTTVGVVFTEENCESAIETVLFASSLGVADIRIISSAQYNVAVTSLKGLPDAVLARHPILRYRVERMRHGLVVRGINETDSNRCYLVLDDMAIVQDCHFPCIIYMREGGEPIGRVDSVMRRSRLIWSNSHNIHEDPICRKNCLDVCIAYNNRRRHLQDTAF